MNYFEQELHKLFGNDPAISDKRFVGRAFFRKHLLKSDDSIGAEKRETCRICRRFDKTIWF